MTERTDHAAIARMLLESVPQEEDAARASAVALTALVDATLALVEQQRIANLLAIAQFSHRTEGGRIFTSENSATKWRAEAGKALGLS